jgi:hypothetical protein
MSVANAVIVGTTLRDRRSPHGERRSLAQEACRPRAGHWSRAGFRACAIQPLRGGADAVVGGGLRRACGEAAIATEFAAAGHSIVSTDRNGLGQADIDFLGARTPAPSHLAENPRRGFS